MKTATFLGSGLCLLHSALAGKFDASSYRPSDVITRDFVIVGGGASGAYAAIGLKDKGKSFALIERNNRLGGHTETYVDPATGTTVDYGVQAYHNDSTVRDFFKRLNVPIGPFTFPPPSTFKYYDFTNGAAVPNFSPLPTQPDYATELAKYPYLNKGLQLPYPIPSDLLLPWGDYIKKYNLADSAWGTTSGRPAPPGPLLGQSALYVFNAYNNLELEEGANRDAGLESANFNNGALYANALNEIRSNVLLQSTVDSGQRGPGKGDGVSLCVKTPTGTKLVKAKQLIVALPAWTKNLQYFGLDSKEQGILSKLKGYPYYTGLVSNTGLDWDAKIWYTNAGANTPYHVPGEPHFPWFKPTRVKGQFYFWYNTLTFDSQATVQAAATKTLATLVKGLGNPNPPTPKFDAFADHSPFHPYVDNSEIQAGFYKDLYSLQGYRNTWYISQLFVIGSAQLWNDTKNILPTIISAAA